MDNTVDVIDGATGQVAGSPINVGGTLYGGGTLSVAVNPLTNRLYVAAGSHGVRKVTVIDGATGQVAGSPINVGDTPSAVAVNPITDKVYVANRIDGTVSVIDGATGLVVGSPISLGSNPNPYDLAVNQTTNRVYDLNDNLGTVSAIDGATGLVVAGFPIPSGRNSQCLAMNAATNRSPTLRTTG